VKERAWLEVAAEVECSGELNYNYTLYISGCDFYGLCYSDSSEFDSYYVNGQNVRYLFHTYSKYFACKR